MSSILIRSLPIILKIAPKNEVTSTIIQHDPKILIYFLIPLLGFAHQGKTTVTKTTNKISEFRIGMDE